MRSSVNTSPLGWRSIRTVKLLKGALPPNLDRAAFIFQVPEVPSRLWPKKDAESSVDSSKTRMTHDEANRTEIQRMGGWRGVTNTAITLKHLAGKGRITPSWMLAQKTFSPELVHTQLEKILSSAGFARNDRLSGFLRFVVEQELFGRGDELKESVIGVEFFGRQADYDARHDSVVRNE